MSVGLTNFALFEQNKSKFKGIASRVRSHKIFALNVGPEMVT